ncbi:MAG: hypothetical protein ACXQS5_06610 [Candidatus Methanospirareceae archaeon]
MEGELDYPLLRKKERVVLTDGLKEDRTARTTKTYVSENLP